VSIKYSGNCQLQLFHLRYCIVNFHSLLKHIAITMPNSEKEVTHILYVVLLVCICPLHLVLLREAE
jgi:hypothetical protein